MRGDVSEKLFTAWWPEESGPRRHVVAGLHVNDWDSAQDLHKRVGRDVRMRTLCHEPFCVLRALGDVTPRRAGTGTRKARDPVTCTGRSGG
jgi:hypothetical protein